jgi:hypothetical protein
MDFKLKRKLDMIQRIVENYQENCNSKLTYSYKLLSNNEMVTIYAESFDKKWRGHCTKLVHRAEDQSIRKVLEGLECSYNVDHPIMVSEGQTRGSTGVQGK